MAVASGQRVESKWSFLKFCLHGIPPFLYFIAVTLSEVCFLLCPLLLIHFWLMFPLYTPLEAPENHWFSIVIRGYEVGTLTRNGLIQ